MNFQDQEIAEGEMAPFGDWPTLPPHVWAATGHSIADSVSAQGCACPQLASQGKHFPNCPLAEGGTADHNRGRPGWVSDTPDTDPDDDAVGDYH